MAPSLRSVQVVFTLFASTAARSPRQPGPSLTQGGQLSPKKASVEVDPKGVRPWLHAPGGLLRQGVTKEQGNDDANSSVLLRAPSSSRFIGWRRRRSTISNCSSFRSHAQSQDHGLGSRADAEMLAAQHKLYAEVYRKKGDMEGECLWPSPITITAMDCRDKKTLPDETPIPKHMREPFAGDRLSFCAGYLLGDACKMARLGFSGRRRAWFDAFHNCALTCKACSSPLESQTRTCLMAVKDDVKRELRLPNKTKPLKVELGHAEVISDTWKKPSPRKNVNFTKLDKANDKANDSLVNNTLRRLVAAAIDRCGQQGAPETCAPWCESTCNVGGFQNAFCCKGGVLRGSSCHGCSFCHQYDVEYNLNKFGPELHKLEYASQSNKNSLADLAGQRAKAGGPGLIVKLGMDIGTILGASFHVGFAIGSGGPALFWGRGAFLGDEFLTASFTLEIDYAWSDWTKEMGHGWSIDVGPELPLPVADLAVQPGVNFACSGDSFSLFSCLEPFSFGFTGQAGLDADILEIIDVSGTVGMSCPFACGANDPICGENGKLTATGRACN